MRQLVLDDQLDVVKVLRALRRRTTAIRLQELRPGEHILDDRVPEILLTCHEPTFITIDSDFFKPRLCHSRYCIVYVDVDFRRQQEIPRLLRQLFRHARFKSHAQRMGKIIQLTQAGVSYWEFGATTVQHALFVPAAKKRRRRT